MNSTAGYDNLKKLGEWKAPDHWLKIRSVDAHTGGEPLRIFFDGFLDLPGKTILERRRYCRENLDALRTAVMWEPRGHADMYGCIVTPPANPGSDFGVIFTHNEGYSSMCGHGIIAVTTVLLEMGLFPKTPPLTCIKIDTPAGLITAYARIENNRVQSVYFHNVPSYVVELDAVIHVPGLGNIKYDLAFGGAYYAFVEAASLGLSTARDNVNALIDAGRRIKNAVMRSRSIEHPFDEDLSFLYGTILIDKPQTLSADSRNVCVFAEGEVDRSPTGTGVSARAAIHYQRGELALNQSMVIESIINSVFKVTATGETRYGDHAAVMTEVEGTAFITGRHEFWINPEDPLREGFILR